MSRHTFLRKDDPKTWVGLCLSLTGLLVAMAPYLILRSAALCFQCSWCTQRL
jgi:hypothetical protein